MKRFFDICLSLIGIVFFFVPMLLVACIVLLKLGKPVFFTQLRPGLNGKPFKLIKFRTMREDLDPTKNHLSDADRLTNFGRWLRATSLDELPELWNVLMGDMSIVGPRPLLMKYLPLYSAEQARRHEIRPGITGWAQINGRNGISWNEKFKLDLWYVENQSLLLDGVIIARTIVNVFQRKNINSENGVTMPPFLGNDNK